MIRRALRAVPRSRAVVYFVGVRTAIKIGISKLPKARLQSIQTSNHERVEMLGVIDDETARLRFGMPISFIEGDLHRRFRRDHIHGEWYRRTPAIERYIARHARVL